MRYLLFLWLPLATLAQTPYVDSTFRLPVFKRPTSQAEWVNRRTQIRKTIRQLFGAIPPALAKPVVQVRQREQRVGYTVESFTFFNGVDAQVPGLLLIPDGLKGKAPAVLYHHYHGGEYSHGKDELFKKNWVNENGPAEDLVKQGYVVLAIDAYAFGERSGMGPNGPSEKGSNEELTWAKINMWKGRSFWGMMVRDDQMALNYLCTRPEVDARRIAAVGMSMGCLRSFWLAALDDRIRATVAVACITRNAELIRAGRLRAHGIYYYVPALLQHFDNESILACIAPRPLLSLSGDQDQNAPFAGVQYINRAVESVYGIMRAPGRFRYVEYPGVKHEYTPAMWQETLRFLAQTLYP
ncbi:alpha/beta hydrolase family protein [Fibrella aestuarina]|nr:alpha/beta hydrolase family protein [Fibrella aestuarina]